MKFQIQTHCKRGHPLTPENRWCVKGKNMGCKTCFRARQKKWKTAKRRALGAIPSGTKTRCPLGHPYHEVNSTRHRKKKKCKTCERNWAKGKRRAAGIKPIVRRTPLEKKKLRVKLQSARQAKKKAQFVEYVDPMVLFERDKGICGICHKEVFANAFQVDHIYPLSRGGLHSYANTQIAHGKCNRQKRAKIPQSIQTTPIL